MVKGILDKQEQSKLKIISKIISFFAVLGRVVIYIAIVSLLFCMMIIPKIFKHVKTTDNSIIFIYSEEKVSLVKEDTNKVNLYVNDKKDKRVENFEGFDKLKKVLDKHSNKTLVGYSEAFILLTILYMYLMCLVLKHLGRLFKNISNGETPFTLDNVDHMKKMGLFMVCAIILPTITSLLFNIFTDIKMTINFNLIDIVQILFVLAMSFVFRYGYNLQEESKKTIYDDKE